MRKNIVSLLAFSCMGLALFTFGSAEETRANSSSGRALYEGKCAACHGKDGKGNVNMEKMLKLEPGALNLASKAAQAKSDAEQLTIISKGKGKMAGFAGKLNEKEMKDVAGYIRGLSGEAPKAVEPKRPEGKEDLAQAAELYKSKCASCHGANGKGNATMAKMFKVETSALDLTDKTTLDKSNDELSKITREGSGKMPVYKGKIEDPSIDALTSYIRTLATK